ncbi:MAG: hypothetical protein SGILL_004768, partial [Bacillariaceae sp.]
SVKGKGKYDVNRFGTPAPILSRPINGMVPLATPMSVHPNYSSSHLMKRPYDSHMTDGFPLLGYTPQSVKRMKTCAPLDQMAFDAFLEDLQGGYIKGTYHSALERQKIVEKAVKSGNPENIKTLGLKQEEDERLRRCFIVSWTPGQVHNSFGYVNPYMPPQQWSHPSPMYSMSHPYRGYPPYGTDAQRMQPGTLKHSPLLRTKDGAKQKPGAEPKRNASYNQPTNDEKDAVDALMATPGRKTKDGSCFSPFLFPTPQAAHSTTPGIGPNWGDDSLLNEQLSKSFCGTNPPGTPAIFGNAANTSPDAPPSTTTKFIASNVHTHTPKVFFKENISDSFGFTKASTPFATGLSSTPARSKAVTGSGPHRARGVPMDYQRDDLLSTAFLHTPKGLKTNTEDNDQSLHHIDACIKSPLHFGSPSMKGSPLRN